MIFLTVGSALPFDRLVEMVDRAVGDGVVREEVFAQVGAGRYRPLHCEFVDFLARPEYEARFAQASAVVSHAGIGTIATALKAGKPIMVMPRKKVHGELVDDHQALTAERFAALGHVLAFSTRAEFEAGMRRLPGFVPAPRHANAEGVARAIGTLLNQLCPADMGNMQP
ncbi:MAG: hypothetical protein KF911_11945 [Pseudomonadales bacterium]|nr:hypothetical protein [Pseudomonadales bacterium]